MMSLSMVFGFISMVHIFSTPRTKKYLTGYLNIPNGLNTNTKSINFIGDGRDETILVGSPYSSDDAYRLVSPADIEGVNWAPLAFTDMELQGGRIVNRDPIQPSAVGAAGDSC